MGDAAKIGVGDGQVLFDLDSIITHEVGHFLGLSHSIVSGSTMYREYREKDTSLRDLHSDDRQGICALYPPDRDVQGSSCAPRHGFSTRCAPTPDGGCSVGATAPNGLSYAPTPWSWLAVGWLGLAGLGYVRRRPPRRRWRR
jgi:hypothetical protein